MIQKILRYFGYVKVDEYFDTIVKEVIKDQQYVILLKQMDALRELKSKVEDTVIQ